MPARALKLNQPRKSPVSGTFQDSLLLKVNGALVKDVILEVLRPQDHTPADPELAKLGLMKNHWVLRLRLEEAIKHVKENGEKVEYPSVRVSVEHPESGLRCQEVAWKVMRNNYKSTNSSIVEWWFPTLRKVRVEDFIKAASPLLPFTYRVVAKTLVPSKGLSISRAGRDRGDLKEHPNGCRDFISQLFVICFKLGMISWEAEKWKPGDDALNMACFHNLIGYRYTSIGRDSHLRIDQSEIVLAEFPAQYNRVRELKVKDLWPRVGSGSGPEQVTLPYQIAPPSHIPTYSKMT